MGITQIASPADQLAPYIEQFGAALKAKFQPNKEFQTMMRDAIGKNPDLVIKLSDMEAKNPGFLQRIGFGNLGENIAGVGESAQGQVERTMKPQQVAATGAAIEAKTTESQLTTAQNTEVMKAMRDNPKLTYQAAVAQIQKPVTQQKLGEQAVEKGAQELTLGENRANLIKTLPNLGTVDFYDQARRFVSGEKNIPVASYMADPQAMDAFTAAMQAVTGNLNRAEQRYQHSQVKRETAGDRIDARHEQNAFLAYQKSGMAGDVDAWKGFLYDPAIQQHAKDLQDGKVKPQNLADENLLEVANGAEKVGVSRFNTAIASSHKIINDQIKKISEGMPDSDRPQAIAELNSQLEQRNKLGGNFPKITAQWDVRDFARDRLKFVDENGKVVESNRVESLLGAPATQSQLSAGAQNAFTKIMSLKPELRDAAIARYEAGDPSPGKRDTQAIRDEMKRNAETK